MFIGKSFSSARSLIRWAAVFGAATVFAAPASARPFHLWNISEIYSNSSGTLQFIELTELTSGQNNTSGQQISVSNVAGTQTNTFTLPNSLPSDSLDHMLLFGTAGVQAAGGPAPDYILPNGFLFSGGGTLDFFGQNSGTYTALPTDGVTARIWNGGNTLNSETNYSGVTGSITGVPEPTTMALTPLAIGIGGLFRWLSRRRTAKSCPATP
jgi:hypothetical protein